MVQKPDERLIEVCRRTTRSHRRRRQPTHGHGHGPRVVQLSQLVLLALPAVSSRCARALTALWLQPRLTLTSRSPSNACGGSAALRGNAPTLCEQNCARSYMWTVHSLLQHLTACPWHAVDLPQASLRDALPHDGPWRPLAVHMGVVVVHNGCSYWSGSTRTFPLGPRMALAAH